MNSSMKFLSGLLIVQFLFILVLFRSNDTLEAFQPKESLYEIDVAGITKLVVTGADDEKVELIKKDNQWVLPSSGDFPVAQPKIETLVKGVLNSMRSYPVATTSNSHSQLKVAGDKFERRIEFFEGDKQAAEVFLGSSPSFKKVHIRRGDEDIVYVVSLNAHDAGTKPNFWFDLSALKIPRAQVKQISFGKVGLIQTDSKFEVQGLAENEQANESELASLVSRLLGQSFLENMGVDVDKKLKDLKTTLSFDVELVDGSKVTFEYKGPGEEDIYILKTSKYPHYFKVSKTEVEALKKINRERLVEEKKSEEESSAQPEEVEGEQ